MSVLELIPPPKSYDARTVGEVNGVIEEGANEISVLSQDGTAYPSIFVDPDRIIKPTVSNTRRSDVFLQSQAGIFKKLKSRGIIESLSSVTKMSNPNKNVFVQILIYIASGILFVCNWFVQMYASFYPYNMMSSEQQCQEFSKNSDWTNGVIRCFKWHPKNVICAVALVNDDVFIYSTSQQIVPLLRHPLQKKVVDISWKPTCKDILAVGCQNVVIVWNLALNTQTRVSRVSLNCARVIDNTISGPITCLTYDKTGNWLMLCGPNTSKIIAINEGEAARDTDGKILPKEDKIIRKYGHGIFRLIPSPDGIRLLTAPAYSFVRIFENINWTCRDWGFDFMVDALQAACWSSGTGRFLLLAAKGDPSVYALTFLDKAEANCVGGGRSAMKVLDLSEYELPNGQMVGGSIQDMVWDPNGERLVISFRENSSFLAVFKTRTKPTLEILPLGFIHGIPGEKPLVMEFHEQFKSKGSVLTVAWSSGVISHIPFQYSPNTGRSRDMLGVISPTASVMSSTPRSLTKFCTSPNASGMPILSPINRSSILTPQKIVSFLSSDSFISPRKAALFTSMNSESSFRMSTN